MRNTKRDFDKEAASWDENPVRVKLASDVASAIRDHVKLTPDMDVLDFGCGTGLLTLQLQPHVHSIMGVDSSQGMLGVLQAKIERLKLINVRAQHLDHEKGDVLEGRYHLIVSNMTLHHVPTIRPLLDEFHQVLAPSGSLCIADLDSEGGKFHGDNHGVFHFGFDRAKLCRELTEAGFDDMQGRTAATVMKPVGNEGVQPFTVFLITGRKRP